MNVLERASLNYFIAALPQASVDNNSNTVATTAANTIIVSSNSGKNTNGSLNSNKDLNGANSKPNVGNKVAGNVNNIDLTHTAAGNKGLAGAKDHATSADQANDLPKTECELQKSLHPLNVMYSSLCS